MLIVVIAISALLALMVAIKPKITHDTGGKIFAFVALFIFPVVCGVWGVSEHMTQSKRTEFCLSCHPMTVYGQSLYVDDDEFIPAFHFQNNLIPRDQACYTCHTNYTMFGDVHSKLRGLKHLLVYYSGNIPDTIKLYDPYNNRECLHCHSGMRAFEENSHHHEEPGSRAAMTANTLSCVASGCHDVVHDAHALEDVDMWKDTLR